MDRDTAYSILDGAMLSDAGIWSVPFCSYFYMSLSGWDHVDWLVSIRSALELLGVQTPPQYPTTNQRVSYWGKLRNECHLRSRCSSFLELQHRRWYPSGVKGVPEDFKFTPVTLANEFMGDGSSSRDARNNTVVGVFLHTQRFSLRGIEILEQSLRNMDIATTRAPVKLKNNDHSAGIRVLLLQSSVDRFMSIIEPYILPSYRYKIKYKTEQNRMFPPLGGNPASGR